MRSQAEIERGKLAAEAHKTIGEVLREAKQRKQYGHEMTDAERFALQTCQKAKNALSAIAVRIQEGKGVDAEIVKAALQIQLSAADNLFG